MILFAVIAMIMLVTAVWLLLRPLLGKTTFTALHRQDLNIAIARERLSEIQAEYENQQLAEPDFYAARRDLEDALLTDLEQAPETIPLEKLKPLPAIIVTGLFPIAVFALYLTLGSPAGVGEFTEEPVLPDSNSTTTSPEALLDQLKLRLQQNPTDARGWSILANAMMSMGNYPDAVGAYEKLYTLTGDEPDVLVRYADALAMAAGGTLTGRPVALVAQALQIDPNQPQGLWLAGMAAEAEGDLVRALEYWYRLEPQLASDPQPQSELRQLIDRVTQLAADKGLTIPVRTNVPDTATTATDSINLKVHVQVTEALSSQIEDSDMLYVYVHSPSGARMPIAAVQHPASNWPVELVLDERSVVMGGSGLSGLKTIIVGAHISRSGGAIKQPGDLVSKAITVDLTATDQVALMVSERLE